MDAPTLEDRVARLERLLDKMIDYAQSTRAGRIIIERLGLRDA